MLTVNADRLVERLRGEYGGSIRAVAEYDEDDYELLYIADEVAEQYSTEDREDIYEDLVLDEVAHEHDERLFGGMGAIQGKVRVFEDGAAAHFCPTDDAGVFVSLDDSADPGVRTLREAVFEASG